VNDSDVPRGLPVAGPAVRWGVVAAVATLILVASVRNPGPGPSPSLLGVPLATSLHLVAYAGLAAAVGYGLLRADGRALLLAAVTAVCYGGTVELVQAPLPSRSASALDVLVNTVGATVGAALWRAVAPPASEDAADAGATSL
jgi:VanZ family protein